MCVREIAAIAAAAAAVAWTCDGAFQDLQVCVLIVLCFNKFILLAQCVTMFIELTLLLFLLLSLTDKYKSVQQYQMTLQSNDNDKQQSKLT